MTEPRYNLLTDAMIVVREGDGPRLSMTLPQVLEALGSGRDIEFCHLQPFQEHAWHAFLVQLAAIALEQSATTTELSSDAWTERIRALTEGVDAAWCLVVDDLSQPAFMQPPVPEGKLSAFKKVYHWPDEIDVLITSRNHDVKQGRIDQPVPDHWIYALISCQTMSGFAGRGTYGIARMNSGYGTRVCVSVSEGLRWHQRFTHDLRVWLEARDSILREGFGYAARSGIKLLWTHAWDGDAALALSDCDPVVIEICRRIRLAEEDGSLLAHYVSTKSARLDAKDFKGHVGDIWIPLNRDAEPSALTISSSGFSYRLLQDLLTEDNYTASAAQRLDPSAGRQFLTTQGLVRGQGTTDGYRQRWLEVPAKVVPFLAQSQADVGELTKQRVNVVDMVTGRVLRPAVLALLQGGPDKLMLRDDRARPWLERVDAEVDRIFFDHLWGDLGRDEEKTDGEWKEKVLKIAKDVLEDAIDEIVMPDARRYRAIAAAERVFHGAARRQLPALYEDGHEEQEPGGETDG